MLAYICVWSICQWKEHRLQPVYVLWRKSDREWTMHWKRCAIWAIVCGLEYFTTTTHSYDEDFQQYARARCRRMERTVDYTGFHKSKVGMPLLGQAPDSIGRRMPNMPPLWILASVCIFWGHLVWRWSFDNSCAGNAGFPEENQIENEQIHEKHCAIWAAIVFVLDTVRPLHIHKRNIFNELVEQDVEEWNLHKNTLDFKRERL